MRSCSRIIMVVGMCIACIGGGAAKAEVVDRIVAVINDDIVLYSNLRERVRETQEKVKTPVPASVLEKQVLEQMIQEKLVEQEMKRLKVRVDDQGITRAIEKIKRDQGLSDDQFMAMIQQEGLTMAQFREVIKKELERSALIEKVFQSKTVVTDADVEQYVKDHPEEVVHRVLLSIIVVPRGTTALSAEEILKRIRAGVDFAELARKYSQGPNASEGGRIGWVNLGDLSEVLRHTVEQLSPGEVSPVISGGSSDVIVKLEDKVVERKQINLQDAKERERIRRFLFQQEVDRKFREWMKGLIEKSYIRVSL